jgi:hypothetical protein
MTAQTPPARMLPGFVYDEARGVVVLQQGFLYDVVQQPSDVWTYDGNDWTLVAATTPLATRVYSTATYDPARRRVIAFGGASIGGAAFRDTWSFDGTNYTQLLIQDSPAARGAAVSFSSPDGHGVVVHGGTGVLTTSNASFDDTWLMRYDNGEPSELCATETDNDQDGLSGCADPDCWTVCTPSCPPGAACDPAAPRCGDGICSSIENCRVCATDCACNAVCGDSFCDGTETQVGCPGDCTP